jgi:hypothetical protein
MSAKNLIVRLETPAGDQFGDTMNAIRSWLDSREIQPTAFKVAPAGLELAFRHEEEAGRLHQPFGGARPA